MNPKYINLILVIIAISTSLLGISISLMGHHSHIQLVTDFFSISNVLSDSMYNHIASIGLISVAAFSIISIKKTRFIPLLGYALIVISVIPLLSLLGSSMWISSLGGFPAIGSGQGVIKYASLTSIGILFVQPKLSLNAKKWLSIIPVLLVLIWIGGMKFTLLEAKGIEDLVRSSPFMSWMYYFWDVQTTSNIIGVYDLFAVALLVGAIFNSRLLIPALIMSSAVFIITQSFIITWEDAISMKTILSTGGHFLIKDLWFIANLLLFWQTVKEPKLAS